MKVLISGDRAWGDDVAMGVILNGLLVDCVGNDETLEILHGAARGADTWAGKWCARRGVAERAFPADWQNLGKAAGPIRNRVMLDEKPDLVVAFHDELEVSRGTKDCATEARRRGIPVWHFRHLR